MSRLNTLPGTFQVSGTLRMQYPWKITEAQGTFKAQKVFPGGNYTYWTSLKFSPRFRLLLDANDSFPLEYAPVILDFPNSHDTLHEILKLGLASYQEIVSAKYKIPDSFKELYKNESSSTVSIEKIQSNGGFVCLQYFKGLQDLSTASKHLLVVCEQVYDLITFLHAKDNS